jgi:formate transporter
MSLESIKIETLSPAEMTAKAVAIGTNKASLPMGRLVLLAILAGLYIGFGCLLASVVTTGASGTIPYGVTRLLGGFIFSLGLILVVIGGAELFTGNALMIIAWMDRKITLGSMLRNWSIVYLGNFLGALLLAGLVFLSGEYRFGGGSVGGVMLNTALMKLDYGFGQALVLGILCNILVCLAVWLTYSARSTTDKILAIVFPITAFVAAGFEHSVANMYALPMALFIKLFDPSFAAKSTLNLSSITWNNIVFKNLLPVTLGNIIGGALFVGMVYGLVYLPAKVKNPAEAVRSK